MFEGPGAEEDAEGDGGEADEVEAADCRGEEAVGGADYGHHEVSYAEICLGHCHVAVLVRLR